MKEDLKQRLKFGVLKLIEKDRMDEKRQNRNLIAKLIHVMLALEFYKGFFEDAFLKDSSKFFAADSSQKLSQLNVNISFFYLIILVIKLLAICRIHSPKRK